MDDAVVDAIQDAFFEGRYDEVVSLGAVGEGKVCEDVVELVVIALIETRRWDDAFEVCCRWKETGTYHTERAMRRYRLYAAYLAGKVDEMRAAAKDCVLEGENLHDVMMLLFDISPQDCAEFEAEMPTTDARMAEIIRRIHGEESDVKAMDPETFQSVVVTEFARQRRSRDAERLRRLMEREDGRPLVEHMVEVLDGTAVGRPLHVVLRKHMK